MEKTSVQFIGIGGKRCATTWLFRCLSEHPEICMPKEKELHFFSDEARYQKGVAAYENFFKDCPSHTLCGEFSASYLSHSEAPKRIKEYAPDIKIIVVLRDPVARALSHMQYWQSRGELSSSAAAKEAIEQYPEILDCGMYAKHIRNWLEYFSLKEIYVVIYDVIEEQPQNVLRELYTFLGVDTEYQPKNITQRQNTARMRGSRLFWFINTLYLKARKLPGSRILFSFGRMLGLSHLIHRLTGGEGMYSSVGQKEKKWLFEQYKEDIAELESILGRYLSVWKQYVK